MFSWRFRRQLFYFAVFAGIVGLIGWRVLVHFEPVPTCFDNAQNQGEQGTDCGGPCKKCVGDVRDLTVVWTRLAKAADGIYDVAAMIDNPNLQAGAKELTYKFKLYDERGVTVALREGKTYLNPSERFVIFEPNIDTKAKVPVRVAVEISDIASIPWERLEKPKFNLIVARKDFAKEPIASLTAVIRSGELKSVKNVDVAAILYDKDHNVMAVSITGLSDIPASSERAAYFTWNVPLDIVPENIEILLRVNQTI
jgi:hypothetical protein